MKKKFKMEKRREVDGEEEGIEMEREERGTILYVAETYLQAGNLVSLNLLSRIIFKRTHVYGWALCSSYFTVLPECKC